MQGYLIAGIVIALVWAGSLWYAYDQGKDAERIIWQNKQTESGLTDVDIERRQNEIDNRSVTDYAFDSLLRAGRFGQLEN